MNLLSQFPLFMGLFDFFKRKKEPILFENVKFENLEDFIEKRKKEIIDKEIHLLNLIKSNIIRLADNLEENIKILKKIDLKDKKADERAKLIVNENLNQFINYLQKLIFNLKNLDKKEFAGFIAGLNETMYDFEKKSLMSYEKATFLIGKELGSVKEIIGNFFKNFNKILNENQDFLKNSNAIMIIGKKFNETRILDKTLNEIDNSLKETDKKVHELEKENKDIKKDIESIKNSKSYNAEINQKKEIGEKKEQIEKETLRLRENFNFKSLSKIYHSDGKKMNLIKSYRDNFKSSFEIDMGESIISLLKEAEINADLINKKINGLLKEKEELNNLLKNRQEAEINKIDNFESKIKKNQLEMENLESEKLKELKRIEKTKEKKDDIMNQLKQELTRININLYYLFLTIIIIFSFQFFFHTHFFSLLSS
jgi:hypothetical protein